MQNLFILLRGNRHCRAFTAVLVSLDHSSFVVDVDTKELEALNLLHYSTSMRMGASSVLLFLYLYILDTGCEI